MIRILERKLIKIVKNYAHFTDTDAKKGIVLTRLSPGVKILAAYADTTVKYLGGAINAVTLRVGIAAEDAAEIIASHDVFADPVTKGLADADMGTGMTRAAAIQGGYLPSWTLPKDVYATINTTNGNCNALTQGSTSFYFIIEKIKSS